MATHQEVTEYKHGQMDITEHEKTFAGFIRMATGVVTIAMLVLIFLALVNA